MKDIPINNPDVLKSLNNFLWYFDNKDLVEKSIHLSGKADRRKYFMSEEYRNENWTEADRKAFRRRGEMPKPFTLEEVCLA